MGRGRTARAALFLPFALAACIQSPVPPIGGTPTERLGRIESLYADARDLWFQAYVLEGRGTARSARGESLGEMRAAYRTMGERIVEQLGALDSTRFGDEDRRAIRVMRRTLTSSLGEIGEVTAPPTPSSCEADGTTSAAGGTDPFVQLSRSIYACYGVAARSIVTPTDTTDRLTVLSRLGTAEDSAKRRALFLSLAPLWRSVNGDGGPTSPYRRLLPLSAARWQRTGSPIDAAAQSLGIVPAQVEATLVRILETWRDHTAPTPIEPWDWWYVNGEASRVLSPRIAREALRTVSDNFYRAEGADPATLGIRFDLEPRPGKTPVAFTQFGQPARRKGKGWANAEAWVFATYRAGGFDNLVELMHEMGHAIHISAVATRPAFADWPDSDPFTEALGDLLALEAYEPAWQQRYLGASAPLGASLRAKYASIVLDVAWALLELRLHRDPTADPNVAWSSITGEYLHIRAHPEWSWWAMRGQLVDAPGYMMNYALGAMVTAALRDRVRDQRAPFDRPDKGMYPWLADRLYRWGEEKSTRQVLRDFLGAELSVRPLVADMSRLTP